MNSQGGKMYICYKCEKSVETRYVLSEIWCPDCQDNVNGMVLLCDSCETWLDGLESDASYAVRKAFLS